MLGKLVQIYVSFFIISQRADLFLQILATLAFFFFLSLLTSELSLFHLKEALYKLYGFPLAYSNHLHHYPCTQRWLSKITVTCTQALPYHATNQTNVRVTQWLIAGTYWTKGIFTFLGEQSQQSFHRAYQNSAQFKIDKLFISGILHLIFQTTVDHW